LEERAIENQGAFKRDVLNFIASRDVISPHVGQFTHRLRIDVTRNTIFEGPLEIGIHQVVSESREIFLYMKVRIFAVA
jgi:hypothetical protein